MIRPAAVQIMWRPDFNYRASAYGICKAPAKTNEINASFSFNTRPHWTCKGWLPRQACIQGDQTVSYQDLQEVIAIRTEGPGAPMLRSRRLHVARPLREVRVEVTCTNHHLSRWASLKSGFKLTDPFGTFLQGGRYMVLRPCMLVAGHYVYWIRQMQLDMDQAAWYAALPRDPTGISNCFTNHKQNASIRRMSMHAHKALGEPFRLKGFPSRCGTDL
eukprot:s5941_g4.t1